MTPKEKAFELFNKYKSNSTFGIMPTELAKQCALIAVDEILKVAPIDKYENLNSDLSAEEIGLHLFEEYWKEVKQEIEKL